MTKYETLRQQIGDLWIAANALEMKSMQAIAAVLVGLYELS